MKRPPVGKRPEFRVIFLDTREDGVTEEYLKHTGFTTEWEAREHMKGISPTRRPQLVRVIAGWPPDHEDPQT